MNKKGEKRMFFWKMKFFLLHLNSFKASLQSCHKKINPNKCDNRNNPKRIKIRISKRTFSFSPSEYQASMCLEASLSFSFFLFFLVNVFSIIFLFKIYTTDMTNLQQQGKELAAYAYLTNGELEKEIIRLQHTRNVKSAFSLFPIPESTVYTQCVVKPWTGYDVTKDSEWIQEEEMVYITKYGDVYHRNRSCSYLELSIRPIDFNDLSEKRNESGEIYLPCLYCNSNHFVTIVYITDYGNKYHVTTECRGIKRTISRIPLSKITEESPCKKCGG